MKKHLKADDETAISELHITPDGRILVFGTSREVLEVLKSSGLVSPDEPHDASQSSANPPLSTTDSSEAGVPVREI
ncbi:hypothetical protein [Rubinisphaera margarita]|uniref:hypothetical protein n=1 Tax=Rubinisphaera margarita TaxID=2909586 RepID=UPI001EE91B2D|nr:hypothetical protein [Rubinisphaera margarita]MCG6158205.1 hypothetical protein [Rubinisphaera margarita]